MGLDIYFHKTKKQSTEIETFRKVNFLVGFFERRFQEEINNCDPIPIHLQDAKALLEACELVIENHENAPNILPIREGFFFNDYDGYDEYYFRDVKEVRDFVKNTLIPEFDNLEDDEYIEFEIWY
jgi:hypothetical protein